MATLIKDSRLCAAAFWRHGLRKGDIVHFVIPNNTEYHSLALGVWTCEGTLSLGDPDLSVSVLKTQLKASKLFSIAKNWVKCWSPFAFEIFSWLTLMVLLAYVSWGLSLKGLVKVPPNWINWILFKHCFKNKWTLTDIFVLISITSHKVKKFSGSILPGTNKV